MTLDEMMTDIRRELNAPTSSGLFSNHELAAWANRGQDLITTKIAEADQNFFEQSDQSLGFIANQEEYQLPRPLWDRKITRVTRTDLAMPKQVTPIRFQEKERYHAANVFLSGSDTAGDVYYIRGNQIGLKPTPKFTLAGNVLIHYLQLPWEMHHADGGAFTATTITMPTATSGTNIAIMRAGRVSTQPNYYVGATLRFISDGKNCRGAEVTVTAWNVVTKVATFTPSVDFSDITGYGQFPQYVILSPIPLEYHDIMYQYATMRAAKKMGDRERFEAAKMVYGDLWNSLVNTIEPRKYDENQHVRTPIDQHFD